MSESVQHLESFSSYTSCIKSFGKAIIPPLLTLQQREEICKFKVDVLQRKARLLERKRMKLNLLTNVDKLQTDEVISTDNIACEIYHSECSASNLQNTVTLTSGSPSKMTKDPNKEMHVSTCNIPSDNICSTVHKEVIVYPNVTESFNKKSSKEEIKPPLDQSQHLKTTETYSCQQDSIDKYEENISIEQISSVSEDERDSITEETEFGSIGTVICTGRFQQQDTDNDSSITCVTESTDLEKYLDNSIDYSSPEDATAMGRRSRSSQLEALSRSNDASSETLVNTEENEVTPCMSATIDITSETEEEENVQVNDSLSYVPQRAYSVDSYMKIIKKCARKLFVTKANSEPVGSLQHPDLCLSLLTSNLLPAKSASTLSTKEVNDTNQELEAPEVVRSKSSGEIFNQDDTKKRIRRNSYTLDHPSPALLTAHADCNCSTDSDNSFPHSCSLDRISVASSNPPAFKKERVNIVLPSLSDRDKYYPVLSTSGSNDNSRNISSSIQLSSCTSTDVDDAEDYNQQVLNKNEDVDSTCIEDFDNNKDNANEQNQQPNVLNVKSSKPVGDINSNNVQDLLTNIVQELQASQATRVKQFLEEQNKQWLKLQEELKQQEKFLCEKFNLVGIPSFNEGPFLNESEMLSPNADNIHHANLKRNQRSDSVHSQEDSAQVTMSEYLSYKTCTLSPSLSVVSGALSNNVTPVNNNPDEKSSETLNSGLNLNGISEDIPNSSTVSIQTQASINTAQSPKDQLSDTENLNNFPDNSFLINNPSSFVNDNNALFQTRTKNNNKFNNTPVKPDNRSSNRIYPRQADLIDCLPLNSADKSSCFSNDSQNDVHYFKKMESSNVLLEAAQNSNFLKGTHPEILPLFIDTDVHIPTASNSNGNNDADCEHYSNSQVFNVKEDSQISASNTSVQGQINNVSCCNYLYCDHRAGSGVHDKNVCYFHPTTSEVSLTNGGNDIFNMNKHLQLTKCDIVTNELGKEPNIFSIDANKLMDETSADIKNDNIYSESDSIKALRDFVRQTPAVILKSYPNQSNKNYTKPLSVPKGSKTSRQASQNKVSSDLTNSQAKAPKQIISESLTNLKRRQSKDIIKEPAILKKFEKLPAFVKGYLTRRLFQTERVQGLITTLQDTVMLIRELSDELTLKGDSVSEHDVELHKQLIVQLMTTFQNVYDIFCTLSTGEQMKIIAESRNFRLKKQATLKNDDHLTISTASDNMDAVPTKKSKLSAATLKTLERRKRSLVDSRTYTIDDFKCCRPRCSQDTALEVRQRKV